ncbi:MAG: hypothetical protein AB1295_03685 [Candidatus Micrarchaeota archaeon]
MGGYDFRISTLDDIDALLDRPGIPDAAVIAAMKKLARDGYFNYLGSFVEREGLSEAVLVEGAELLANAEEPRPIPVAHVLIKRDLSEDARKSVMASLIQAIASMDEMALFASAFAIHRLLNQSGNEEAVLTVIEGLEKQGSDFAKDELAYFSRRTKNPRLKDAAEQALGRMNNPLAGDGVQSGPADNMRRTPATADRSTKLKR